MAKGILYFVGIYCALSANFLPALSNDNAPLKIEDVAGDLVRARTDVYNHAIDLKAKYAQSPTGKQLTDGKALYDKAQSAYADWIATLHFAILQGSVKKLAKDPEYIKKSQAAGQSSGAFVTYAEEQTAEAKGFFVFASDAVTIGLNIWNSIKDRQLKERQAFVKDFDPYVAWNNWASIGADSTADKSKEQKNSEDHKLKGEKGDKN